MNHKSRRSPLTPEQAARARDLTRRRLLHPGGAAPGGVLQAGSRQQVPVARQAVTPDDLHYATLLDVARLIEAREVSPVDLTRAMLGRIEDVDRSLKSYATVMPERALAAAEKAEREIASGDYRGPMHGMPVAVKDLCYTKGTPTMGGLAVLRDFRPDHDATAVARLDGAGAVLLGKLNLTEGAMGGYHRDFDIPVNPWNADYWSGASSSGSGVAVAAGLCFAALGTDTGGSIRFPSMANGIVGLKPSYGRVSRYGVIPLGESLDHVGPMARATADAAIVLETIAGFDAKDPTSLREPVPHICAALDSGIGGLRIGIDRAFSSDGIDPGLTAAIGQALGVLEDLGAAVVDVQMPPDTTAVGDVWFAICSYEAHKAHSRTFPSRADEYGPHFREFLEIGASVSAEQYATASAQRRAFVQAFTRVFDSADAVVCPAGGFTFAMPPGDILSGNTADLQPLFDAVQMYFTIPADFAGTPALTVPCGFSANGIPYALQFLGPRLSEALLCRIGYAYENATDWHDRHPDV